MKKLMIGGQALLRMGSSRSTSDTDYLVDDQTNRAMFIKDEHRNIDYCNAAGHPFFKLIWDMEKDNDGELASPQAILELKAYAFVQHCLQGNWNKANDAEFDIKFLVLNFDLSEVRKVKKFISFGELTEVNRVIQAAKRGL